VGGELKRETTRRCPICGRVSTEPKEEGRDFFFLCANPECKVGRIYGDNAVMLILHENILVRPASPRDKDED